MILKEIVINGFKSFADSTRIELGTGMTTIVGPNGCGKSNVVDAIRWVLGEQSAKSLRGGKMHDVIFAGTDQRAPLQECEVTLRFTDCEKELGTAFNEVEITRRVMREGSSHYYLNGNVCRLKDIQQLFMDTGVGRVSYSFMVQGQIDQILSTNPEERRTIFEEAAGITKYKSQRKETLNKLALVDQNLSRANDVIEEVNRQMGSLKRQAGKAIRYKKLKHRLDHLDLAYNSFHYANRNRQLKELSERVEKLRGQVNLGQGRLKGDEETLEEKKSERSQYYEQLQEVQQETYDLRSERDQAENQADLAEVRKKDTEGRIVEVRQEIAYLAKQVEELINRERDDAKIKQLQLNLVDSSEGICQEKVKEVEMAQAKLTQAEAQLQNKKQEFMRLERDINLLRSKCSQLEVALKTDDMKVKDLRAKGEGIDQGNESLGLRHSQAKSLLENQELVTISAQKDLESAKAKVAKAMESFREGQKRLQDQDRSLAQLNAQLSILEGLQAKLEGFSDGAKSILQGKLGNVVESNSLKLLTKDLEIEEGYTQAFETLLGQAIDAIALEEIAQIIPITQRLVEKELGRACLFVNINKDKKAEAENLPSFLQKASELVKSKDASLSKRWANLLCGCYFTENLNDFIEFWEGQSSFEFSFIATKEGELVDARGFVYAGSRSTKNKAASYLHREKEIRQLKKDFLEKEEVVAKIQNEVKEFQEKLSRVEEEVEEKRKQLSEANNKLSEFKIELREAQNAKDLNFAEQGRIAKQLQTIEEAHKNSASRLNEGQKELEQSVNLIDKLREEVTKMEEGIVHIRQERDQKREELSELRIEFAQKRQRLDLLDQNLHEVENQRKNLNHRREQKLKELDVLGDRISEYENQIFGCRDQVESLEETLKVTMARLDSKKAELIKVEGVIKQLEDNLSSKRKELHKDEVALKEAEVSFTKEQSEVNFILEKVRTEYNLELEEVDWKLELWEADEEFETRINIEELEDADEIAPKPKRDRREPTEEDIAQMEQTNWTVIKEEVKALRDRLSTMGAVNLVAIEEYIALKERHEFLVAQCNDLINSKQQLMEAIDNINKTSQAMFKETFEKVRENFKFTFDALFGGGVADLQLMEAEDVLEAGIEIIARPPGTKLRSLSLLSGGQKTMTAVALLFAIYKVKPSPFCVLDELDAPLDDANIGRFTTMLREFTRYSQFLVISHNKRTIAASDTLYGVTMQERGVTKLISMRFNKKDAAEKAEGEANEVKTESKEEALV